MFQSPISQKNAKTGSCSGRLQPPIANAFLHESVVGSVFTGELVAATAEGVVPAITGSAWITRYAEVVVDPTDPFPEGFRVGDIW